MQMQKNILVSDGSPALSGVLVGRALQSSDRREEIV